MSSTRIPFTQMFKTTSSTTNENPKGPPGDMDPIDYTPRDVSSPPRGSPALRKGSNNNLTRPAQVGAFKGSRTPQMLEYERQAEERAREQEAMQVERDRIIETEGKMQRERERIEREEYEMRQFYEAEALKHLEELRVHQEEVRRHQDRLRAHERMLMDHDATSEAFAKVIAMPASAGAKRNISLFRMGSGRLGGFGGLGGGGSVSSGSRNGSLDYGYGNGNGNGA